MNREIYVYQIRSEDRLDLYRSRLFHYVGRGGGGGRCQADDCCRCRVCGVSRRRRRGCSDSQSMLLLLIIGARWLGFKYWWLLHVGCNLISGIGFPRGCGRRPPEAPSALFFWVCWLRDWDRSGRVILVGRRGIICESSGPALLPDLLLLCIVFLSGEEVPEPSPCLPHTLLRLRVFLFSLFVKWSDK